MVASPGPGPGPGQSRRRRPGPSRIGSGLRPPPRLLLIVAAWLVIANTYLPGPVVSGRAVFALVTAWGLVAWAVLWPGDSSRREAGGRGLAARAWLMLEQAVIAGTLLLAAAAGAVDALRRAGARIGPGAAVVTLCYLTLVVVGARWRGRPGLIALGLLLGLHLALMLAVLRTWTPYLDVYVFEHDAARALLAGHDPYAITFPDIYPPGASGAFYAPGLSVGGRVQFGYPYPPPTLLAVLPGYLAGDVRLVHLAALVIAAGLLWWVASDAVGRAAALLLPVTPLAGWMVSEGWVEPIIVGLLVAAVVAARRRWRVLPVLLGLLLASKQYFVVALPVLWLLCAGTPGPASRWRRVLPDGVGETFGPPASRPRREFGRLLAGVGCIAGLVILPFWLWNPGAFWHSVVALQFRQPFRADSTSLLVWSVLRLGWPPVSVSGWLPLLAGLVAAGVVAWRAPRSPAGFAAGSALALLTTILLSKQAFANYYLLVLGGLLAAIVLWRVPAPEAAASCSAQVADPAAKAAETALVPSTALTLGLDRCAVASNPTPAVEL